MRLAVVRFAACILAAHAAHAAESPRVHFNFVDAPLELVIGQLNQSSATPYALDEGIKELVTLHQDGLPLDQAIEQIKQQYRLKEIPQGGRILLTRARNLPETDRHNTGVTSASRAIAEKTTEPMLLQIYSPAHLGANELALLLDPRKGGILPPTSRVREEPSSNQLLVRATASEHRQIEQTLARIDKPRQRVRVYSRIVIMRKQAKRELGTRLGLRSIDGSTALAGGQSGAFLGPEQSNQFTNNLAVDFGTIGVGSSIAFGYSNNNSLLELEFQALESSGLVDIVATPQVLVNSGQLAYIATGTQVPYLQQTAEGETDVLFKDALLSLQVVPRVETQQRVDLSIQFAMDTVGALYSGVPAIDTNKLDTKIKIAPGQTLVLGGIFSQVKSINVDKVPGLGDIPVLGRLFRYNTTSLEEAELLIFLTPELVAQ